MLIGYMRISKNDGSQIFDLQRDALIDAGVSKERLYQDIASGKKEARLGLQACLKALQPGNILVVWKLDRLGRDLKHLITIIDELRQRHIGFKVLAGHGTQIDTTSANGRLILGLFATLAEYERELIIERTHAGLKAARARGRLGGRPRKMTASTLRIASATMADPSTIACEIAKQLNITTATLYTYVNSDGSLKEPGKKLLPCTS